MNTTKKQWPSDAIMIIAANAGQERRENMQGWAPVHCRDCNALLMADPYSISLAENSPLRHGRPVKFLCMTCLESYLPPEIVQDAAAARLQEVLATHKIRVLSREECAKAEWRVCSTHRNMPGLTEDTCSNCGCIVYYDEASIPLGTQKPVCLLCHRADRKG